MYMRKYLFIWTLCLTTLLFFGLTGGVLAAAADDDPEANNTAAEETSVVSTLQDLLGVSSTTSSLTYHSSYTNQTYTVPSTVVANGIDISSYNGTVDWDSVKEAGIDFVMIRAGFRGYGSTGSLNTDTQFVTNIEGAQAAGIKVGVYFYSQAITTAEAEAEAEYVLNLISGYTLDLPVAFDFEYAEDGSNNFVGRLYTAKLSSSAATTICTTFCDTILAAGYTPMVYADCSRLTSNLNTSEITANNDSIWLAHYTTNSSYTGNYVLWQYTNTGSVGGVTSPSTGTDCNFSFVSLDKLGIPFTDVAEGKWYLGAVHYAYQYHLLQGTTSSTFEPDTAMSRAMLVTVLYREAGSPTVDGSSTFTDLTRTWYQNAVTWAQQNDIVSGTTTTTFDPDTAVTREQMAAILYRYSKLKGYDLTASGNLSDYNDGGDVSNYAKTALQWAIGKGYISGFDNGTLQAKATATRAQVAMILKRFCEDHDA